MFSISHLEEECRAYIRANTAPGTDDATLWSNIYFNLFLAGRLNETSSPAHIERYVWRMVRNQVNDVFRSRDSQVIEINPGPRVLEDHYAFKATFENLLEKRPKKFRAALMMRFKAQKHELFDSLEPKQLEWKSLAQRFQINHKRLKVEYHNLLKEAKAYLVFGWYKAGSFYELNQFRLSRKVMERVAFLAAKEGAPLDLFFRAFGSPDFNRCIQNTTWLLSHIAGNHHSPENKDARTFLVNQLTGDSLFRGNMNYLAEALMGFGEHAMDELLPTYYYGRLNIMKSRVQVIEEDVIPETIPCLFDVINIMPLRSHVKSTEIAEKFKEFKREKDNVDLHRTLTWALMRSWHTHESLVIPTLKELKTEWRDPINAYYVVRYIRKTGLQSLPSEALPHVVEMVRMFRGKFSKSRYFRDSLTRIKKEINGR